MLTQASFSILIVQARKIVEDVPGVDEAEIHLELADESKIKSKKRTNSRKSKRAVPTGTASDKIVNASNMKSAASPQTTTDEEDIYGDVGSNRNRLAKSTIPRRPPMIDTSSHTESDDENMYADDFDQEDEALKGTAQTNHTENAILDNASKNVIDSYISPQKVYGRNSSHEGGRNTTSKSRNPFHSPDPRTMSPASQQSARQSARSQRIASIVQDPGLRQLLRQMNEHILRSVHYRRFKYEKRLVSVGTTLADMDRSGRGALSVVHFKNGLLKSDCGLSSQEIDVLVEKLIGEEKYSGKNSTIRYADVIDALRKLQRQDADGNGSSTEEEKEGQRQAILKYKEYRNKIAEETFQHVETADQGAGEKKQNQQEIVEENDGAEEAAELTTPAKRVGANNRVLSILNETSEPVNTPSPKLTYAEKDRKDLEAKLHKLQSEQQQALENAKKSLKKRSRPWWNGRKSLKMNERQN